MAEAKLDSEPVTIEAAGVTLDELMNMVSRRVGVDVHRAGNIYYVGAFRSEDRALLVRRVRRLEANDIEQAIGVLQSGEGRSVVFEDGLVVVGDRLQVLTRIIALLDQVEAAENSLWVVQFWLVSLSDAALRDLGFDATPALDVAVTFAEGSANAASSVTLNGGIDAVLTATDEQTDAELVIEHLAIIRDGEGHQFFEGDQFPVRVQRVSDEGTATTTDVSFVDTGVTLGAELREYSRDEARLAVEVNLSEVVAVIDGFAPQTSVTRFDVEAIVESAGVYLLRSHKTARRNTRRSRLLSIGRRDEDRVRTLQLWARAMRVGGPPEQTSDVRSERARKDDDPASEASVKSW